MYDVLNFASDWPTYEGFIDSMVGIPNKVIQEEYDNQWPESVNLGYETSSSIRNLGSVAFIIFYIIIKLVFYLPIDMIYKKTKYLKRLRKMMRVKPEDFIGIFIQGYIEFLLSFYFNFKFMSNDNSSHIFSSVFAALTGIFGLVVMPTIALYVATRKRKTHIKKSFFKLFSVLYRDLNINSRFSLLFYFIYMVRRIVFLSIIFF